MVDHHDDVLNRAIGELRALPPLDREAVSRIVAAAARAREAGPAEDDEVVAGRRAGRARLFRWPAVAGIAAAAAFAGFATGMWGVSQGSSSGALGGVTASAAMDSGASASAPAVAVPANFAARETTAMATVPTQFVFESRVARQVTLVGDFNGWNEQATPLVREPGSSAWSVTVSLRPGRHVYAFMVDDTLLQTDPRAPETKDPDFGVTGSVIIVGAP